MNEYRAKLVRVIDGDTVVLDVDLGFHVTMRETFRLVRVNCPEMSGEEKGAGQAAKAFVEGWFATRAAGGNEWVEVWTYKPRAQDKYGRWLASVGWDGKTTLNDTLVQEGHAARVVDR